MLIVVGFMSVEPSVSFTRREEAQKSQKCSVIKYQFYSVTNHFYE